MRSFYVLKCERKERRGLGLSTHGAAQYSQSCHLLGKAKSRSLCLSSLGSSFEPQKTAVRARYLTKLVGEADIWQDLSHESAV